MTRDRAERRYRRWLRLLPAPLRREAGGELVETFRREYARVESRGRLARARFWLRMLLDLLATSAAERWFRRSSAAPSAPRPRPFAFLGHDVRDALRSLRHSPVFTIVVVLTLALGTGVNAAIFSVVDALLFKALPYADADRIVRVAEWPRTGGNFTVAPAAFLDWRTRQHAFATLEARLPRPFTWIGDADVEELRGAQVTVGYFDLLGVRAVHGRTFGPGDDAAAEPCRVVISHRLWMRRLAGDPAAVGRSIAFGGAACTLTGVLPPDSVFDRVALDVYRPLTFRPADAQQQGRVLTVFGRLAPGVSLDAARTDLVAVAAAFNATRGPAGRGWTAAVTPLREVVVRPATRQLAWVLFGAVGVVLLIACVNVAGLVLSRTIDRRRDIAVRAALGAERWRLFRYLVVESLMLSIAGAGAGLLVGSWALTAFSSLVPAGTLPPEAVAALDLRTLGFTIGLALVVGLLVGTLPAWRGASAAGTAALASGGRTVSGSRHTSRLHNVFVVVEVATALVLVTGAVLLVVSFTRLTRVDPGFEAGQILTLRLDAPASKYPDSEVAGFYDRVIDALQAAPGIASAAAITSLPLGGWRFGTTFAVDGVPSDPDRPTSAHIQHVAGDYFRTLGIPIVAGRDFTRTDDARSAPAAIVNETFARRFLPGAAALSGATGPPRASASESRGRFLTLGIDGPSGPGARWEIVGVAGDVKTGGLGDAALATPEIYVPNRQSPMATMFLAVRGRLAHRSLGGGGAADLVPAVRAAVRSVDPQLAVSGVMTMDERIGASVATQQFQTAMISAFGVLAALVACIGVYATRSQSVRARRREMGIRIALGATRRQVVQLVLGQTLAVVAIGLVLGLAGALWLTRFVESWLFETRATDPVLLVAAAALLGAAAFAAGLGPARRAARIDPLATLRQE